MDYLTGDEAAALLGVSRRTVYRWAEIGRIPPAYLWRQDMLAPYIGIGYLPKGPLRRRWSVRYTTGRHSFYEVRHPRAVGRFGDASASINTARAAGKPATRVRVS